MRLVTLIINTNIHINCIGVDFMPQQVIIVAFCLQILKEDIRFRL